MKSLEATSQHTADSIYTHQNDILLLKCLVAQRKEYSHAKHATTWKDGLTALFAVVCVLASCLEVGWLTALSSLFAIALLITSKYIDSFANEHKKHAAAIQQYFDVTLYTNALSITNISWGPIPSDSDIAEAVSVIDESSISGVANWYSDYSNLPATQEVFRCQQENIRWDFKLRKEYKQFQLIASACICLVTLFVGIAIDPPLTKVICVISWVAPIADYAISNLLQLNKDIRRLTELKKKCNAIESNIANANGDSHVSELISIQQLIRENREKAYMVPDCFYQHRQQKHQNSEDKIAVTIQSMSKGASSNNTNL